MKKILIALSLTFSVTAAHAQYENTAMKIGQTAPDLMFQTPEGKTLTLKEVNKDRYVLVDFWASWCGPCRRANPELVQLYKEYNDKPLKGAKKGFAVYSVSLDKSADAWKKAIADDGLLWSTHVSDLGGWSSKGAELYGVSFIPQAFLIGPDGKVVGKYMLAGEVANDLKKLAVK